MVLFKVLSGIWNDKDNRSKKRNKYFLTRKVLWCKKQIPFHSIFQLFYNKVISPKLNFLSLPSSNICI